MESVGSPARTRLFGALAVERLAPVALLGVVIGISAFQLWPTSGIPPGLHRDEASVAYNAYSISRDGRDQDGGLLPLYIVSWGDYKSPVFVYLLAAVFRVFDPNTGVARETGAAVVLAAILLVGLLAYRRTRSLFVTGAIVVLGGLTPWLYQLGRTAFDTTMQPLAIALFLVVLDWAYQSPRHNLVRGLAVGLTLGLLTYAYVANRLLAPLLGVALIVFAGRGTWKWLVTTWAVFGALLVPLAAYAHNHPGALSARWDDTTFFEDGMSIWEIARTAAGHYLQDVWLWTWITSGDPKPYIHSWGAGQLHGAVVLLALVGAAVILARRRPDRFWLFVLIALALSPIPAALTDDRNHALRMLPLPILLLVLAIPGTQRLVAAARKDWPGRAALLGLAVLVAAQFVWFQQAFRDQGPKPTEFWEAAVPQLLHSALEENSTVYIDHNDRYARTHALWYAVSHDLPESSVVRLPDGGIPPPGSYVFGRLEPCDYVCTELFRAFDYWYARAVGPKSPEDAAG